MDWIFEITDKSNRKIHLSEERWKHINQRHPEIAPLLKECKNALLSPTKVTFDEKDHNLAYYYKYIPALPSTYLLAIVNYLNLHGFIITMYLVKKIK